MLIKIPPRWRIPERETTSESLYFRRREILKALGFGGVLLAGSLLPGCNPAKAGLFSDAARPDEYAASLKRLPPLPSFSKNPKFRDAGRALTAEHLAGSFNNFYEFSADKDDVREKSKNLRVRPWTLEITGLVSKPKTWGIEELLKTFPLEERIYRFRCVEAWAMTVPWIGFPLAKLLAAAEPKPGAKFVRFSSLEDPEQMPSQRWRLWAPWPYREGLRIDEAMNELALLAVGIYGHALPNQHGAPLRLVTPWKYGFKNAKSIVRIEFVEKQPATFWNDAAPDEYGFYSNINPEVPHPRWSQATERRLGESGKFPTAIYNGYGTEVAHLYKELKQPTEGPPI